jgi:hypothetical protein
LAANPFALSGRWYKGNLHAHTTNSDGRLSPEEVIALYRDAGYDFLCITDHEVVTQTKAGQDSEFLLLPGAELNGGRSEIGERFHVLGFGLRRIGALQSEVERTTQQAIDWIVAHGGATVLAHPHWSGHTYADLLPLTGHLGVEVFNTTCEVGIGKGISAAQWDDLLNRGQLCWGFAVDDCHSTHSANQAAILVKAPELTQDSIMAAIHRGQFYATTGPVIERVEWHSDAISGERTLHVHTSPVEEINFVAQGWHGQHLLAQPGQSLTEASFTLDGKEWYLRVECRDAQSRRAWTNPVLFVPQDRRQARV